jgi:hypothetical protein
MGVCVTIEGFVGSRSCSWLIALATAMTWKLFWIAARVLVTGVLRNIHWSLETNCIVCLGREFSDWNCATVVSRALNAKWHWRVLCAVWRCSWKRGHALCTCCNSELLPGLWLNVILILSEWRHPWILYLGAFALAELWKATLCLVRSIYVKQLGYHWTYFHDIWCLNIFRKSVENVQVALKSDKNNGYFMWRRMNNYGNISLNSC